MFLHCLWLNVDKRLALILHLITCFRLRNVLQVPGYKLHKVLGYGSFSCVCLATCNKTGDQIALKRIGNVLQSPDNAKRVLREISILRRAAHPNLIGLRDAFVRPSATGVCRMINGKLVSASIDLYISMEFANGGDLVSRLHLYVYFHSFQQGGHGFVSANVLFWQFFS